MQKQNSRTKLSLVDGRFKLTEVYFIPTDNGKSKTRMVSVRYPQIQILKNRIRVGCTTLSREAVKKLLGYDVGFVQGEAAE
jgi:hypothetical protein